MKYFKFSLDFKEEFLQKLECLSKSQAAKMIFESQCQNILKGYNFTNTISRQTLFEIIAVKNISESEKSRYEKTKEGMLQFILYPKIIAITLKTNEHIPDNLFELEGKKLLVQEETEVCRSVILLQNYKIIQSFEELL